MEQQQVLKTMLQLNQISLRRGTKLLLEQADLSIYQGQKVGLVGHNGVGKTSLFKLIKGELDYEHGSLQLPAKLEIAEIAQDIPSGTQSALDFVIAGNKPLAKVLDTLKRAEQENDGDTIAHCHHQLLELDGYRAQSKAAKILTGLSFAAELQQNPVDSFSGGWRMRLNLARVFMQPSDLLLLDEPTNHLDMEAIVWLENWLSSLPQTLIIISHDRHFLDNVIERIVLVKHQKLRSFTGNYSNFETTYAEQLAQQQITHERQQAHIAHLQKFVDRFQYKASKAKQAQSRLKQIARITQVATVQQENPFRFEFKPAPEAGSPMINFSSVNIGYCGQTILQKVGMSIYPGDRIALLGINGAGKSTLVKALAQKLPVNGEATFSQKLAIGYFNQHQIEHLRFDESAFQHLQQLDDTITEREARQFLGGFNFRDDRVFEPIHHFSGGEKSRLALALLVWQQPNLLLLDEPSNHLDLDMRQALATALQTYEGALVLISHDRYLLDNVVDQLILIHQGKVSPFDGDISDYQQLLVNLAAKDANNNGAKKSGKTKKQTRHIERDFEKLEQKLVKLTAKIETVKAELSEPELYQSSDNKTKIEALNEQLSILQAEKANLEAKTEVLIEQL